MTGKKKVVKWLQSHGCVKEGLTDTDRESAEVGRQLVSGNIPPEDLRMLRESGMFTEEMIQKMQARILKNSKRTHHSDTLWKIQLMILMIDWVYFENKVAVLQ